MLGRRCGLVMRRRRCRGRVLTKLLGRGITLGNAVVRFILAR